MDLNLNLKQIAYIESPYDEKFGVPRQSGLCSSVKSKIVFENEYRDPNAFRLLDSYSHIWIIWGFSENYNRHWSATVRPPKMGGNERAGVFATRSPFRPNPVGLSCVKIENIDFNSDKTVITVSGADLVNGTPIYDIKPYIPYTDSIEDAKSGISVGSQECHVDVEFLCDADLGLKQQLEEVLSQDPHPLYQNDENRVYKMSFSEKTVSFRVNNKGITVVDIE